MALWKILVVVVFGGVCLTLALSTIIMSMSVAEGGTNWLWLAGLVFGTIVTGALFTAFLRNADQSYLTRR